MGDEGIDIILELHLNSSLPPIDLSKIYGDGVDGSDYIIIYTHTKYKYKWMAEKMGYNLIITR